MYFFLNMSSYTQKKPSQLYFKKLLIYMNSYIPLMMLFGQCIVKP